MIQYGHRLGVWPCPAVGPLAATMSLDMIALPKVILCIVRMRGAAVGCLGGRRSGVGLAS
jgi:hypothetical protein